jgi:hypothetical protein
MKIASRATRDTPARIPPRSQVGLLTSRKRSERNRQAPPRHARPFLQLFGSARVSRRLFRKSRSRSTRPKLKRLLLGGAATDARTLRSVVRAYGYSTLNSVEQRRGGCSGRSRHPEGRGLFWALAAEGIPTTRPKGGLTCCSRSQEGGCGSPRASLLGVESGLVEGRREAHLVQLVGIGLVEEVVDPGVEAEVLARLARPAAKWRR